MAGPSTSALLSQPPIITNGTAATSVTSNLFSPRTRSQQRQNKRIAKLIRQKLGKRDQKEGYVYVAKQAGTGFCKVGFAEKDAAPRIKALGKCHVVSNRSCQVGRDFGAHRAEQLVHKLLEHCGHDRLDCPCGCKNREWFHIEYQKAFDQVVAVLFWLRRKPYRTVAGAKKLKPVWKEALNRWEASQTTLRPLEWEDFFYNGPKMERFNNGGLLTPFPQSSPSEKTGSSLNGVTINVMTPSEFKSLLRTGFRRAKGRLTRHRNPASRSPRTKNLPLANNYPTPPLSGDARTAGEEPNLTPSEPMQSRRRITFDRFYTAQEKQVPDVAVSEFEVHTPRTTLVDNFCESPSDSPDALNSIWPKVIEDQQKELPPSSRVQEDIKGNPAHAEGHRDGADYYLQATLDSPEEREPSETETDLKDTHRSDKSFLKGDDAIDELAIRLACMPGAFPTEDIEEDIKENVPTDFEMIEVPRNVGLWKKGMWPGDTSVQRDWIEECPCGTHSSVIDSLDSVAEVSEVPPVRKELHKAAPSPWSDLSDIPVAISAPIGETPHLEGTTCSTPGGAVEAAKVTDISARHSVQDTGNMLSVACSKSVTGEHPDQGGECKSPSTTGTDPNTATSSAPRLSPHVAALTHRGRKIIIRFPPVDPSWELPNTQRKLEEDLNAMDSGSNKDEQRPTRNDCSDEPSKDVRANGNQTGEKDLDAALQKLPMKVDTDREGYRAGWATADILANRKMLNPTSRLQRHANTQNLTCKGSSANKISVEEPAPMRAIADRPFFLPSEYIDRTTFRLREMEWGTEQRSFKATYPRM